MKYVSIDIETTGLDPEKDDIVEFGAVIDDLEHPKPVDELPKFHGYVLPYRVDEQFKNVPPQQQWKHVRYHGDPFALSMHPTIFRRIAKREAGYDYYERDALIRSFKEFLRVNGLTEKVVMVGKNFASFDLQFLKRIPSWYLMENSYRTFDPTPYFFKLGVDKVPPSTRTCLERAGFKGDVPHTAIEDAQNVVRLVRHGVLVREPVDYSNVPDEFPKAVAPVTPQPNEITGTSRTKPTPTAISTLPPRVPGCSVVVGIENGKPTPKVTAFPHLRCKEKDCVLPRLKDNVFCSQHNEKFIRTVLRNSPLVKHHG